MKKTLLLLLFIVITSCYKETSIYIEGDFTTSFVDGDQSVPVIVKVENGITGADTYQWEFEGGSPATLSEKNPGEIFYKEPGTYSIKLHLSNVDGEIRDINKIIEIKEGIHIQLKHEILKSNYSPVEVMLTNTTPGEELNFQWDFENGLPASFTGRTPPNVVFTTPGDHDITLTVSNGFESEKQVHTINVAPYLISAFVEEPELEDDDYQNPVVLNFINKSISATSYKWTFEGGFPATSTEENPVVTFTTVGQHQVTLEVFNDKTSHVNTVPITILPNTNLQIFNDVKLGVNAAHNTNNVGAMFSTATRLVYKANEITDQNSPLIDIVFQGINSNFNSNKFIAPDNADNFGFLPLKNAQNTIFINSQNLCNCGLNFTETQFDAMVDDTPIKGLNINYSAAAAQEFGFVYPRIILFQKQDGRKGVIKIKEMVRKGTESYILCDIKVQKQ